MVKLWVSLLVIGILWIFGTLPWIVIWDYLCSHEPPIACPNPSQLWQQVGAVIAVDIMFIGLCGLAIHRLRRLNRAKRQSRA
ncbi:hypothetical protein H6G89_07320 [Oscillatoria sp. FACHB-1407]|uniref:hypothetical protein n=1 Tax=Oscillatoria sp. FACHB-1407 TaxID=2692847 RepID=UPI00168A030A|nr:hypothetical protein [Oscillatoria sp. FACHB-1407]MBD2460852.1 hypothetical protein [Oscillatoria sp. FACHB-1407]